MLSGSILGSEAASITGAGHFCINEKPGEVNEHMKAFLITHS